MGEPDELKVKSSTDQELKRKGRISWVPGRCIEKIKQWHKEQSDHLQNTEYRQTIMAVDTLGIVGFSILSAMLSLINIKIGFPNISASIINVLLIGINISLLCFIAFFAHSWKIARNIEKKRKLKEASENEDLKWKGKLNATLSSLIKRKACQEIETQKS